jgi:hypothetical protein
MDRWIWKPALAAGAIVAIALSSWAQEDEITSCEEACYEAEERCVAACPKPEEAASCEDRCEEKADLCVEKCE